MIATTYDEEQETMAYFNGGQHGWNDKDGYHAPTRCTAVYCDTCADAAIPLPATGKDGRTGSRHWETDFKWAPRYGAPCHACGGDA